MPFDPSTLTDDARAYVDQERTRASQTAYENARKKLMNDTDFVGSIRSQLEEESRLSVEEKLKKERELLELDRKNLLLDKNRFTTQSKLLNSGLTQDQVDSFLPFLLTDDATKTEENTTNFLNVFKNTLDSQLSDAKNQLLNGMPKPKGSGEVSPTERDQLLALHKKAQETNNPQLMARVIREAQMLNIQL